MIFGEHVVPRSEVIRAILLEESPCCGVPAPIAVAVEVDAEARNEVRIADGGGD